MNTFRRRRSFFALLSSVVLFAVARVAFAEAPAPIPGGFTLAVLPDTQIYAWKHPDTYALAKAPGGFNDGEDLWQKLVSQHPNFALVVSGHVCITGRLDSQGKHGNVVHQMVVDYQNQKDGGEGYLRLLQFHPDGRTVTVRDYSPVLDQISDKPGTSYDFTIAPAPAIQR